MKRPANRNPCKHFEIRVKRLAQLYDFARHSFEVAVRDIDAGVASGSLKKNGHFPSQYGFVVHHHVLATKEFAEHQFPTELRSTLLVRLVTEFEVFLVSYIGFLVRRSGTVPNAQALVEWPRVKLLSFRTIDDCYEDVLAKDLRQLTSGGLSDIRKYYRAHLNIDLAAATYKYVELEEIHERRHLHVHRAGDADESYVHKYPGVSVGDYLAVDDAYLRRAMDVLLLCVRHLRVEGDRLLPEKRQQLKSGNKLTVAADEVIVLCDALFVSPAEIQKIFDPVRPLLTSRGENSGFVVADFVHSVLPNGKHCEWVTISTREKLRYFFEDLQRSVRAGTISRFKQRRLTAK